MVQRNGKILSLTEHDKWAQVGGPGAANLQLAIQAGKSEYAKVLLSAPKNKPFYRQFEKQRF